MNEKHLAWIIPLMLIIGYLVGLYFNIPKHIDITIDYGEGIKAFTQVFNSTMNCSLR